MMNVDTSEAERKVAKLMAEYVDRVGMGAPYVVKTESGMLARTLINITPPKDRKKTATSIENRIQVRFARLKQDRLASEARSNVNERGVWWYAWSSKALFGAARDMDMTRASVDEIYELSKKVTKSGKVSVSKRGRQTVYLTRRVLTTSKQAAAVIKRIQGHIGRLKAGWLPAWKAAGSHGKIPNVVAKHAEGARGRGHDGTGDRSHPTFTLVNSANGVKELTRTQSYLLNSALKIRAKAMATKLKLYLSGKIKHDPALEAISE